MDTYVEHIWVRLSRRCIVILDNEGYDATVHFKWDEEGMEGFMEQVAKMKDLPEDLVTICQ